MEIEDAVHTAILTLKEGLEGSMSESSLEIGIATQETVMNQEGEMTKVGKFRRLNPSEIKDYLANIA
jgi:20S proteasome subunit alpha 2